MKKHLGLIVAVLIGFVGVQLYKKSQVPSELPLNTSKECISSEWCIGVYLTPWCPYCKKATYFLKDLKNVLNEKSGVGMMVVVGDPRQYDLIEYASQFPQSSVIIDRNYDYYRALKVQAVPTWFVLKGKEFHYLKAGAYNLPPGAEGVQIFLDQIIELPL